MTNRNSLLGRSRPKEKLSREEIAALDKVTAPEPRPQHASKPEKPAGKKGGGQQLDDGENIHNVAHQLDWSSKTPTGV